MKWAVAYGLVAGLASLLFYPALAWLAHSWLSNPYYGHGFLLPPLAAFLAWQNCKRVAAEPRQGLARAGLALTLASLAAALWAMYWQDYFAACLVLLALLAAVLLYLEGWRRLRHWLFPLFFLALMVPLPCVDMASPWFEAFTARWAAAAARLVGIPAVQQGSQLVLPGTSFVVGAPCSGLRSLVAMVTVAVGWIYVVDGRPAAKALMLAAVVPLVALANVLRIAILLGVAAGLGQAAALSYYHDWSSPLLFMVALGLLLGLGKVLGCSRIRDDWVSPGNHTLCQAGESFPSRSFVVIVALLAASTLIAWGQRWLVASRLPPPMTTVAGRQDNSPLPAAHVYFVDLEGWYRITPYETAVNSPYDLTSRTNQALGAALPAALGEWQQVGPARSLADDPLVVEYLGHPSLAFQRDYQDASGQKLSLVIIGNEGDDSFLLFSHTPEICYPSSSWRIIENCRESAVLDDRPMYARYLLTEFTQTGERLVVLYWYLWDNAQRDSRDGVLSMRVNVYVLPGQSEAAALARAWDFVRQLFPATVAWKRF
ncbi:MAG: exosortase [Thermoflexales bacterium]|nr:exosortase [Thermoflexales bacterium]